MINLLSKAKQNILTLLFANEDKEYYIREIARLIGSSPMGAQKNLVKLEQDGILVSNKRGLQKFYSVNKDHPAYEELKGLAIKSFGIARALKDVLEGVEGIKEAFIYGSFAKGEVDAQSDIDLFIIGDVDYNVLSKAARKAEDTLGREINFDLYSEKEFIKKKEDNNPYINDLINDQVIELIKNGKRI